MKKARVLSMAVLTLLLLSSQAIAFERLVPDFRVDQGVAYSDMSRVGQPVVAHDSLGNFWVVWKDERSDLGDIYARRFDAAGNPLSGDFRLDQDPLGKAEGPAVAVDSNDNFIVAWHSDRLGNYDIWLRRFDSSGTPLGDAFRVDQAVSTTSATWPRIALDSNDNFIIVWTDNRSGNDDIYARRYDSSGTPIGNDFRVDQDTGTAAAQYPSVARDTNDNFTIAWQDYRAGNSDIYARRYDSSGNALGNDFRVDQASSTTNAGSPAVAADGAGNTIIAWTDWRLGSYGHPYARRYDSAGAPIGNDFRLDQYNSNAFSTSIAVDGSDNIIVTYHHQVSLNTYGCYARRFDSSGAPLGDEFRVDQGPGITPGSFTISGFVATDSADNFIVVWADRRSGTSTNSDIYARRYDGSGNAWGDEFRADDGLIQGRAYYPSIAPGPENNFVVAWDYNSTAGDIYARRVDSFGNFLADNFLVDQGTDVNDPCVAVDGNENIIFAWEDYRTGWQVYARRFGWDETPLGDNFQVNQTSPAYNPAIATDESNNFIVVWDNTLNVYVRRFDADGNPLGNEIAVDQGEALSTNPSVAVDSANNFIVTWQDTRLGYSDIYARRFDSSGNPLGNDFLVDQAPTGKYSYNPSIAAYGSGNFIITYGDSRLGGYTVYARLYNGSGNPLGNDFRVDQTPATANTGNPTVAVDSKNNFSIAWMDYNRNSRWEVYARRFDSAGNPLGNDFQVPLFVEQKGSIYPVIAADSSDNIMFAWQRNIADAAQAVAAVWAVDTDGDGVGDGSDCDPLDPYNWASCATCADADGDGINGAGCDLAEDCDDAIANAWTDCSDCADADGDGYGAGTSCDLTADCDDVIANVWTDCSDCADIDNDGYGAGTSCDLATDCDDSVTTGPSCYDTCSTFYDDTDADTYGDSAISAIACAAPAGYVADATDCIPTNGDVYPGATELCDGIDNQCPDDEWYGIIDEGCPDADSDGDGLSNSEETDTWFTDPYDPDTDRDGLEDGFEVVTSFTLPAYWDTDDDGLPDGYEHFDAELDPGSSVDGALDFDGDGNPNAHEYYNGTDMNDPDPTGHFEVEAGNLGCAYWGDADGTCLIMSPDLSMLRNAVARAPVYYGNVIPDNGQTQDLDRDGNIGAPDVSWMRNFVARAPVAGIPSRSDRLVILEMPGDTLNPAEIEVGSTCAVTLGVLAEHEDGDKFVPGFAVHFDLDPASTGEATIFGGDGDRDGVRYDISGDYDLSSPARVVLRIDEPGTIILNAHIPACGQIGTGRSAEQVILETPVVIIGK